MRYLIDLELFERYVRSIKAMQVTRHDVEMYAAMDAFRQQIHNEILAQVGVNRSDKDFSFWLAERVAKYLED